jgi:hypothetical protein
MGKKVRRTHVFDVDVTQGDRGGYVADLSVNINGSKKKHPAYPIFFTKIGVGMHRELRDGQQYHRFDFDKVMGADLTDYEKEALEKVEEQEESQEFLRKQKHRVSRGMERLSPLSVSVEMESNHVYCPASNTYGNPKRSGKGNGKRQGDHVKRYHTG